MDVYGDVFGPKSIPGVKHVQATCEGHWSQGHAWNLEPCHGSDRHVHLHRLVKGPGKVVMFLGCLWCFKISLFGTLALFQRKHIFSTVEGIPSVLPILAYTKHMAGSSRAHGRGVPHLHVPWLCIPWRRTIWRRPKEHFQLPCIFRTCFPILVTLPLITYPASTCSDGISQNCGPKIRNERLGFGWRFRRLKELYLRWIIFIRPGGNHGKLSGLHIYTYLYFTFHPYHSIILQVVTDHHFPCQGQVMVVSRWLDWILEMWSNLEIGM